MSQMKYIMYVKENAGMILEDGIIIYTNHLVVSLRHISICVFRQTTHCGSSSTRSRSMGFPDPTIPRLNQPEGMVALWFDWGSFPGVVVALWPS